MATEWEIDCIFWFGEVLTGKYKHWCPEWDGLPVDETCMEFVACICHKPTKEIEEIKKKLWTKFDAEWKGANNDQECKTTSRSRILQ